MFGSTVRGVGVMEASGEGRVIVIRSIPVFKVLIMRGGLDSTSLARPPFIEAPVQSRENYRSFMHMCVCVCVSICASFCDFSIGFGTVVYLVFHFITKLFVIQRHFNDKYFFSFYQQQVFMNLLYMCT